MRRCFHIFVLGLFLTAGCAHKRHKQDLKKTVVKTPGPPAWVKKMPHESGYVCAVGAVSPTFYRDDGLELAAEKARSELARNIEVHIWSYMKDVDSTRGGYAKELVTSEVESAVTDGVIAGAEVRSTWYDEHGAVSRVGMTYALACMSTSESVSKLAEKLREAHPDEADEQKIEQVKERAQSLFDELEKMETAKAE